jgi:hypothetical protein
MNNYRKGEVEVEFGNDARLIRFDLNAMCILEQNLGLPFHAIMKSLGYNAVREAIFVGLRHKGNKKLSRAEVGRMMGAGDQDFAYYTACVLEAVQGATGMDLSEPIHKLRGEPDEPDDDDESVDGCDGPDAGNPTPTQADSTG